MTCHWSGEVGSLDASIHRPGGFLTVYGKGVVEVDCSPVSLYRTVVDESYTPSSEIAEEDDDDQDQPYDEGEEKQNS